jgi:flagellar secretion chaperone FliS
MYSMNSYNNAPGQRINQYISNEILSATPEQLIMKIYDFAIVNCQRHNIIKTNEALQVLINALNFDDPAAKEISIGLFRLYQFGQDQMRKRKYDVTLRVLTELKEAWETALKNR